MTVVTIRVASGVHDPLPVNSPDSIVLRYPAADPFSSIETVLTASGETVHASGRSESENLLSRLREDAESEVVLAAKRILVDANRKIVQLIVQELKLERRQLVSGRSEWSSDGEVWNRFPLKIAVGAAKLVQRFPLSPQWGAHLQAVLDMGVQPSAATIYLIEAKSAVDHRFAWIQATIAAELAIKEALMVLEPRFEALLMELPSPPLNKLYGSVLERIVGERSPFLKELQRGAEVRNRLVHRPDSPPPAPQETVDYVNAVEQALLHLHHLQRRDWPDAIRANLHPYRGWHGREPAMTIRTGL